MIEAFTTISKGIYQRSSRTIVRFLLVFLTVYYKFVIAKTLAERLDNVSDICLVIGIMFCCFFYCIGKAKNFLSGLVSRFYIIIRPDSLDSVQDCDVWMFAKDIRDNRSRVFCYL